MLEIYYGGIEDNAHDWYRNRFVYKKSKYVEQTNAQNNKGFRIFLNSMDVEDTYTRFDIVAGYEGVPVSFLIRSVWDSNFKTNERKNGNPHIALKTVGLKANDHDKEIGNSDIFIEDTSKEIKRQKNLMVKMQRRINVKSDFEEKNHVSWNFYLE